MDPILPEARQTVLGVGSRQVPATSVILSHERVFSGLRASFGCQFLPCKLHQIRATYTSHLFAQVHGTAL